MSMTEIADLNAEICEVIFKWRYIPVSADANGENRTTVLFRPDREPTQDAYNTLPLTGKPHKGWFCPRYANDWWTAIELARVVKLTIPVCIFYKMRAIP